MKFEITKQHREQAWRALDAPIPPEHAYGRKFLETGEDPGRVYPITARFAKVLMEYDVIHYQMKRQAMRNYVIAATLWLFGMLGSLLIGYQQDHTRFMATIFALVVCHIIALAVFTFVK